MISVEHLTKCYGGFTAVDDLSFEIEEGHVYGFLGPNGAGKSTTMNIMTGCLSATKGRVVIDGYDIFQDPYEAKKRLGYPLIFSQFGDVYLLTSYGSILAFFILGAALIAVGMFISSLTDNQGMAAGIGIAVILLNYYSVSLPEYVSATAAGSAVALVVLFLAMGAVIRYVTKNGTLAYWFSFVLIDVTVLLLFVDSSIFEGLLPGIMEKLSLFERFTAFVNGVFDMTAIVYYCTVIAFFLFLSVQSMEKRRYN